MPKTNPGSIWGRENLVRTAYRSYSALHPDRLDLALSGRRRVRGKDRVLLESMDLLRQLNELFSA